MNKSDLSQIERNFFILIIFAVIAGDEDGKDIEGFGHIHLDFF